MDESILGSLLQKFQIWLWNPLKVLCPYFRTCSTDRHTNGEAQSLPSAVFRRLRFCHEA